jgi:hypothetical protein
MADDKLNLDLGVNVTSQGTDKLTDLEKIVARIKADTDRLESSAKRLKDNFSSIGKGSSDGTKAAKDALDIDRDRLRVLKMKLGYEAQGRAAEAQALRQLAREEERGIQNAERARKQAHNRAMADARELNRPSGPVGSRSGPQRFGSHRRGRRRCGCSGDLHGAAGDRQPDTIRRDHR